MATILRQANAGDIRDGLQAAQDAIVNAVANNLSRMQGKPSSVSSTQSFNDKFAYDNSTFEGVYLDVEEFRDGVEGALGLPGKDIYAGMEMEFCFSWVPPTSVSRLFACGLFVYRQIAARFVFVLALREAA
eukprot:1560402-Rhodomonas_salina.2